MLVSSTQTAKASTTLDLAEFKVLLKFYILLLHPCILITCLILWTYNHLFTAWSSWACSNQAPRGRRGNSSQLGTITERIIQNVLQHNNSETVRDASGQDGRGEEVYKIVQELSNFSFFLQHNFSFFLQQSDTEPDTVAQERSLSQVTKGI